ncbi:LADA_0C01266g1_1 [Lachancea dasiensis]|uniref:LADA_0C01266g1_1 n=1 Tax=Lachancea dasiensis TaxID=1072105 RepID=A0A1G4IXG7_9SACH|nr:LADA_0C01266g1_1 [Lachancea dasiensis]
MNVKSERKLRSKSPAASNNEELFNFDNPHGGLFSEKKLTVLTRHGASYTGSDRQVANKSEDDEIFAKKRELYQMPRLLIEPHHMESLEAKMDPLSDEIYAAYHRKMYKQEVRMVNQDKIQAETEAERLGGVLEDLQSEANWVKRLLKTTIVQNPDDEMELQKKRSLTQSSIMAMLQRFGDMKNLASSFARGGRAKVVDPDLSFSNTVKRINNYRRPALIDFDELNLTSDEDDERLSNSEIKAQRKSRQERRYGGTVVIQLRKSLACYYKYAIVAEPMRPAYIVRCSKAEKEKWCRMAESLPPKFKDYAQFPKQSYVTRPVKHQNWANGHRDGAAPASTAPKKRTSGRKNHRSNSSSPTKRSHQV